VKGREKKAELNKIPSEWIRDGFDAEPEKHNDNACDDLEDKLGPWLEMFDIVKNPECQYDNLANK